VTLPAFELLQPESLTEALKLLAETPEAVPIAGGTCLLVDLRERSTSPNVLLDLSRIEELRRIETVGDELIIGATVTIAGILGDPSVAVHAGALRRACETFAAPLIRNRATIGGNLAHASPAADTAPPLLLLDTAVEIQADGRKRVTPLHRFFAGPCETHLRPAHLVTAVRIPIPEHKPRWAYEKIRLRKADAISVVTAAALAVPSEDGPPEIRIALGAVAPTPVRAWDAEEALKGKELTPEAIAVVAKVAAEEARPIDDLRGSAEYRRREVEVLVRRCLSGLLSSNGGEADGA